MYLDLFFARPAVFTAEELTAYLRARGTDNPSTRHSFLHYHEASGRLLRIRPGLYAVVGRGREGSRPG